MQWEKYILVGVASLLVVACERKGVGNEEAKVQVKQKEASVLEGSQRAGVVVKETEKVARLSGQATSTERVAAEAALPAMRPKRTVGNIGEAKQYREPYVVTELSELKVREGSERPQLGDVIYSLQDLPGEGCGEFWVHSRDGYVERVFRCGDESHTH